MTNKDQPIFVLNINVNPFSVSPEEILLDFQIEIVELQCPETHKTKFKESSLIDLYKSIEKEKKLISSFKLLRNFFVSPYIHE